MPAGRRVRVTGVKRSEISTEDLALVFWLQAKRKLKEKRERDQKLKSRRQQRREECHER